MPPAQNVKANGSDQRSKDSGAGSANGAKNNGNISNSHHPQRTSQSIRRTGQQTFATQQLGAPPRTAMTAAPSSNRQYHNHPSASTVSNAPQQTTLFQRLVTEEVQELKAYARIIENQNHRLVELERIHGDLENRLELEARGRTLLEATLERQERSWTTKYHELEQDRDQWKNVVSQEQAKNARLFDQVVRKDQDIHRMLQRKVSYVEWQRNSNVLKVFKDTFQNSNGLISCCECVCIMAFPYCVILHYRHRIHSKKLISTTTKENPGLVNR